MRRILAPLGAILPVLNAILRPKVAAPDPADLPHAPTDRVPQRSSDYTEPPRARVPLWWTMLVAAASAFTSAHFGSPLCG